MNTIVIMGLHENTGNMHITDTFRTNRNMNEVENFLNSKFTDSKITVFKESADIIAIIDPFREHEVIKLAELS